MQKKKKEKEKECQFQIIQVSLLKQGQNIWKHCQWLFQVGVLIHATNRLLFSDSNNRIELSFPHGWRGRKAMGPIRKRQGGGEMSGESGSLVKKLLC